MLRGLVLAAERHVCCVPHGRLRPYFVVCGGGIGRFKVSFISLRIPCHDLHVAVQVEWGKQQKDSATCYLKFKLRKEDSCKDPRSKSLCKLYNAVKTTTARHPKLFLKCAGVNPVHRKCFKAQVRVSCGLYGYRWGDAHSSHTDR